MAKRHGKDKDEGGMIGRAGPRPNKNVFLEKRVDKLEKSMSDIGYKNLNFLIDVIRRQQDTIQQQGFSGSMLGQFIESKGLTNEYKEWVTKEVKKRRENELRQAGRVPEAEGSSGDNQDGNREPRQEGEGKDKATSGDNSEENQGPEGELDGTGDKPNEPQDSDNKELE